MSEGPHFLYTDEGRSLLPGANARPPIVQEQSVQLNGFSTLPGTLISTAITVLVIIALVVSHSDDVKHACGMDLWNWSLANLVLWIGLVLVLALISAPAVALCTPLVAAAGAGVVILVAMITMVALGATFLTRAAAAGGCLDALSANFMKAPLLLIMGWVSVGMQCLTLLVLVCGGLSAGCWGVVEPLSF